MRHSGRKNTAGRKPPVTFDTFGQDDPHDTIALELLRLWIGLSRLREDMRTQTRAPRPPSPRASRRRAA